MQPQLLRGFAAPLVVRLYDRARAVQIGPVIVPRPHNPSTACNVFHGMNRSVKFAGGIGIDLFLTLAVAWACIRWIPGFDVRGPFLVMSPLFAVEIFFVCGSFKLHQTRVIEGEPKRADADLIQSTAVEFDLGPVNLIQRRCGVDLRLVVVSDRGNDVTLPENWTKLDYDAKRFAVVWNLADSRKSSFSRILNRLPTYACRAATMVVAGINLWLILACHALGALWFARHVFWQRERMLTRKDAEALKIMRNLKAAMAFAKSDPMNSSLGITPEWRIMCLKKAAARMGIG